MQPAALNAPWPDTQSPFTKPAGAGSPETASPGAPSPEREWSEREWSERVGPATPSDDRVVNPHNDPNSDADSDPNRDPGSEPSVDPVIDSDINSVATPLATSLADPVSDSVAESAESSATDLPTRLDADLTRETSTHPVSVEGSETDVQSLSAPRSDAVDSPVDRRAEDRVFVHEIGDVQAGDNRVEDVVATGLSEAVSRETSTVGDGPGPRHVDEDVPVEEIVRRRTQLTGRPFPKPVQSRVLTVANQKGGVGKTTTTVNVAAALAQAGLKILVIDLDPQGNASTALGIDHHADVPSIYDVLVEGAPLLEVVQPCTTVDGLFCAPATIDLAGAEIELVSLVARESRLQKAIAAAAVTGHEFDYILIDCPPSLGLLTVNAMVAASEVFIPIQCETTHLRDCAAAQERGLCGHTSTRRCTCQPSC